jgi:glycosyltransferase involved in cell wall biosynthesis
MRIAVISSSVFPVPLAGYGGLEYVAWHTAQGLKARGHSVCLFAPDGSTCEGADVAHTGPAGIPEKDAYNRYWMHLPNFHAIIDHSWQKYSYGLKAEGKLHGPILGVLHAPVETMLKSMPPGVDRPCFVCISDDQRAHFEGLFNRPARTCHNGVDPEFYKPLDAVRQKRALFLARFSTIKGADLAIGVCKDAGVPLDLVGDTTITNEPEYFQQCQAHCDGEQIRMLGGCSRGGTVRHYSKAHCLIHPNMRFREPFGLAPVEAMMCGLPVIGWENGAMRETVIHGKTGYLVNSYEELVGAIKTVFTGDLPESVRHACRENALRFSVAKMAERYEQLIQEAIQGGW